MIAYRHKILLDKLRSRISSEDIQNAKTILFFAVMLGIMSFFGYWILGTINNGMKSQARVENMVAEVEKLEKENKLLKSERDSSISETEIEAQYRVLGYKKPGEQVYIINRAPASSSQSDELANNNEADQNKIPNWQIWLGLIFN